MGKAREALRVLLIQIRGHRAAEQQEYLCFLERCGLRPDQLATHNLVDDPGIAWEDVAGFDAVLIGGAGGHSATREHPFTAPLAEVVLRLIDDDRPLFGSCWGHQFLAWACGGTVIADHENEEVGTHTVELTAEGARDPLLAGFPRRFAVQLGHHDRIGVLPPGFQVLARSERCPHQAIRLEGKPVYGSQFHSELTESHIRERLMMYRDEYLPPDADPALLDEILGPSEWADGILDRFLALST